MEKRKFTLTINGHEIEVTEDDEIDVWDGDRSALGSTHLTVGALVGRHRTIEALEHEPRPH